jgi:ABC-type antimicrobial peptide transport system permease subunit
MDITIIFVGLVILVIFVIIIFLTKYKTKKYGGNDKTIVVDTLNMVHELFGSENYKINQKDIYSTIKKISKKLKSRYSKIIFVIKSKNSEDCTPGQIREKYEKISKQLQVSIYLTEKLKNSKDNIKTHSSLGRDDFYIILTAWKYRCSVLGQDYYKDLKDMKFGELDSFYVIKYEPFKKFEEKDYINPTAHEYKKIRRPTIIRWENVKNE